MDAYVNWSYWVFLSYQARATKHKGRLSVVFDDNGSTKAWKVADLKGGWKWIYDYIEE